MVFSPTNQPQIFNSPNSSPERHHGWLFNRDPPPGFRIQWIPWQGIQDGLEMSWAQQGQQVLCLLLLSSSSSCSLQATKILTHQPECSGHLKITMMQSTLKAARRSTSMTEALKLLKEAWSNFRGPWLCYYGLGEAPAEPGLPKKDNCLYVKGRNDWHSINDIYVYIYILYLVFFPFQLNCIMLLHPLMLVASIR